MSILSTKPIKKIPEFIGYRHPKSNVYVLSDKNANIVGRMVAYPEFLRDNATYYPDKQNCYSLYIKRLFVEKEFRGKGAGQAFLNIAAAESYQRNCHGNVHLIAQSLEGGKHPQKFYRRYGFDSQNRYHIELIDKAIEDNTKLPPARWITPMFLRRK